MRRSLFGKYFATLFLAATLPVLLNGLIEATFGYRDRRETLDALLRVEADAAAGRIESFIEGIVEDLRWSVQRDWDTSSEEQHRLDALRVLRQASAIVSIALVDQSGSERLFVSRVSLDREAGGADRSRDPAVVGARSEGAWFGPVTYYRGSEPFMVVSVAGNRRAAGVAVAEVNLTLVWDVVSGIRVGQDGRALVIDGVGQLVAHPDISKVLEGTDDETAGALRRLRDAIEEADGRSIAADDMDGLAVIASMADVEGPGWTVLVEQPEAEALAPIHAAVRRAGWLLLGAVLLAAGLAAWAARRMAGPVRQLEKAAKMIGAGEFGHRIEIGGGDELGRLATRFNEMAEALELAREREDRMAQLKRFLAPQVAEIIEREGDEGALLGQRAEVVVAFCDLRGFTAFSTGAEPEEVMQLLADYYQALGSIVTRCEATVTNFSADGVMILVNAPVPCPEPALRAVRMAMAMQDDIQRLIGGWRERGHPIGFGVGLAMGWAMVGRIGYEGRHDYTAIGNVVNLASRLCSSAEDRQILVDSAVARAVSSTLPVAALGSRQLKGFDRELKVFKVVGPATEAGG